jgi:hypothetical protein
MGKESTITGKMRVSSKELPNPYSVPQSFVAAVYGCTHNAIVQWDCPRNEDGSYNLATIVKWREDKLKGKDNSQDDLEKLKLKLQCDKLQFEVETLNSKRIAIETYEEETRQRILHYKRYWQEVFIRNLHFFAHKSIKELRPIATKFVQDALNTYAQLPKKK